LLRSIIEIWHG